MIKTIKAAMKVELCDTVLKNVTYLNVFTNEWLTADIAISNGKIVGIGNYKGIIEYDYTGKYAVPSFIDSHVHIESSLATPSIFASEILPWGTTTIVADPHEIANVSGVDGLEYIFNATNALPINAYVMLPSCVPASPYENSGARLSAEDLLPFTTKPNCLGLGEMMDNYFIYDYNQDIIAKLNAFRGKNIDGHAPILNDTELNAYRACGITNDHETSFAEDVIRKTRLGFKILTRQGSSCKNLTTILKCAIDKNIPYYNFAYCSDDKHISDIRSNGHISYCIKLALSVGVPLVEAYKMASYYPANNFGLKHLGAIAPSYQADIAILDNLESVNVVDVFSKGILLIKDKMLTQPIAEYPCPKKLKKSVHIKDFNIDKLNLQITHTPAPVINIVEGELLTKLTYADINVGAFQFTEKLNKVIVLSRHTTSDTSALGIVGNYGINGAIASTVSHDSHNIVCIGNNDKDMEIAIRALSDLDGGYAIAKDGKITAQVALPIAGLLSDENPITLKNKISEVVRVAHIQGVNSNIDPLQPLSFLALTVLPEVRISDLGVYNVIEKHKKLIY